MEAAVAAHAQADRAAYRSVFGQPARADAEVAIGMHFLTHDQLQHTIGRDRGD
ncbi:hypothetical protein D3C80_2068780 [compost metagenome]